MLIDRSVRGGQRPLRLTTSGRRLVEHAAALAAVLADAEADMSAFVSRLDGPVRLAAFPTAIRALVAPALRALARDEPGLRPIVMDLAERPAIEALHRGELDVVLVEDDAPSSAGMRAQPPGRAHRGGAAVRWLRDDPYRIALPRDWPVPQDLAALAEGDWILSAPGSAIDTALHRFRRNTRAPLRGVHTCLEFPAALALVDAGLGVASSRTWR